MSKMGNLYVVMQQDALKMDKEAYLEEYKDWITDAHHIWERMHGPEGELEHPDIVTTAGIGRERENR